MVEVKGYNFHSQVWFQEFTGYIIEILIKMIEDKSIGELPKERFPVSFVRRQKPNRIEVKYATCKGNKESIIYVYRIDDGVS